jgi:alpha-glucosidase
MGPVTHETSAAVSEPGATVHHPDSPESPWWRDAVIYQVYPRSWADSDGDGVGDLPGITARLPYLRDLGVDAVWLSPFYVSPMNDAGYDVTAYRDVDPLFGSLADADAMVATAHDLGLKVLVDLVPNHTSTQHRWFQEALASPPGSPARDRYIFRDGRGQDGEHPPNNWPSVFGGLGWTRVTEADGEPGQWYLHLFDVTQPDLNWQNDEVREEFHAILRFWVDRGVDGFRVDVAHGLVKRDGLPDWSGPVGLYDQSAAAAGDHDDDGVAPLLDHTATASSPMWDQDGVHEIYRGWRKVLDAYGEPDRILCAEAWVTPVERLVRYVRPDEMHQAFNFDFLECSWDASAFRPVIEASLRANDGVGAPTTWVLSNHDVVRHASRLGLDQSEPRPNGIQEEDPQPDAALGLRRARAATAMMLGLPGSAYLYQGEELGLPEHTSMPDPYRQDPTYHRTDHEVTGRDGCRVPMPWVKDAQNFGFGPGGDPWLPQPDAYGELAVDQQAGVEGSTLELYRTLLDYRRRHRFGHGGLEWDSRCSETALAYRNVSGDGARTLLVVTNFGPEPVGLPEGHLIAATAPLTTAGAVPQDTTAWVKLPVAEDG